MESGSSPLVEVLNRPECLHSLNLAEWDYLVRQARRAGLLSRIYNLTQERGLLGQVPDAIRHHLESSRVIADKQVRVVQYEVRRIQQALAGHDVPVVLLKGAAYVMANLPPAQGRIFHDVDILVPRDRIDEVERQLRIHGWLTTHQSEYDQRYYRQWMHELPPLRHASRKTVLDVHHAILPLTSRLHPDPAKLLGQALDLGDNLKILSPPDMLLHSATHLFHDGEMENAFRDLVDLDGLLRHFGQDEAFWAQLVERARELELVRPLYYALRYTQDILGTPIPEGVLRETWTGKPGTVTARIMDALLNHALVPDSPEHKTPFNGFARGLLYVRGHYLRMPLYLLIPHLVHQFHARRKEE
mgnify:FL=1